MFLHVEDRILSQIAVHFLIGLRLKSAGITILYVSYGSILQDFDTTPDNRFGRGSRGRDPKDLDPTLDDSRRWCRRCVEGRNFRDSYPVPHPSSGGHSGPCRVCSCASEGRQFQITPYRRGACCGRPRRIAVTSG